MSIRSLIYVACAYAACAMASAPAQAQTFHYVDGLDPRGHNWLALRVGPSYRAPWSPTKMGPGTLLTVVNQYQEWLQVRVQTSGEIGWANSQYVYCCRTLN